MDKEIRDKHYRIVGALQTLEDMANRSSPMPCDRATEALLATARFSIQQAVLSAWDYAEKQTAETVSPVHSEES